MKIFRLHRSGQETTIIELSFRDVISILFGRELYLQVGVSRSSEKVIIRQPYAYDWLNTSAPASYSK